MNRALGLGSALVLLSWAGAARAEEPIVFGPYVPSPPAVVTRMLQLAKVGPDDFVIDLGSGDGRIPIAAAKEFGARGLGVDIDADLVAQSIENAKKAGVAGRVKFLKQDLFTTDISKATVVTLYLLPKAIDLLSEKLQTELRPGTRVVTHDYPLVGWTWEYSEEMQTPEKLSISGVDKTSLFYFVIPARVQGSWKASVPAAVGKSMVLELSQDVQQVWGKAWLGGAQLEIADGALLGEELSFSLQPAPGKKLAFKGKVAAGKIEGTVTGTASGAWSAEREEKH